MKKLIGFARKFGASVFVLSLPVLASAAGPAQPGAAGTGNGGVNTPTAGITKVQSVLDLVCIVFGWAFYFLVALAVLFIIIAAFKYLRAGGDPEKVKEATNTILYAAIAVGVALLAKGIPLIVGDFLGSASLGLVTC